MQRALLTVVKHLQKRFKDTDPQRSTEKVFLSERPPLSPGLVLGREDVWAGGWWGRPKEHCKPSAEVRMGGGGGGRTEKAKDSR